jgi:xanthine dehydrogenase YagS FAD-binding subunit
MQPFKFFKAKDSLSAINVAAKTSSSKFIAGGTNVIDLMKLNVENPAQLIDINSLDLYKVQNNNGSIVIGSLVKNTALAYHPLIVKNFPVLSQAILSGASAQLRNMASTAGNIMQRTRCYYFYDTAFPCNKREPGSGCSALTGYNRIHAILGTSDKCIATHPSDMSVAMIALDAVIHVQGSNGKRSIPFAEFHLLPGQTPHIEHNLKPGELITSIESPPLPFAKKSLYLKARDRASYEFALASAAVALDIENGVIKSSRIALGGVGTKPWRALEAEQLLVGTKAGKEAYNAAAEAALKNAQPYQYNKFKVELAKRTLVRALSTTGGMI